MGKSYKPKYKVGDKAKDREMGTIYTITEIDKENSVYLFYEDDGETETFEDIWVFDNDKNISLHKPKKC